MANIAMVLKGEIQRLARKEIKTATDGLRKQKTDLRKNLSDLKQRIASLEREVKRLQSAGPARTTVPATNAELERVARISAKGIRSLRLRLKLSQEAFGKLVGVSGQSVYNWERQTGPLALRRKTRQQLMEVRQLGAREVKLRLAQMPEKKK